MKDESHPAEKPGELVSYRNIRGNNVSHHLSFGQDLARGVNCAYCGEQAVIQHTTKPEGDRDYSCLGCNTHYKDITPKGLIQGRTAHIIELRRRMEEAIRLKEECKYELMRGGAIFEDPETTFDLSNPKRREEPKTQDQRTDKGNLGLAGAVGIAVSNAIDGLNPLNG